MEPTVDAHQDWRLLYSAVLDRHIIMKFTRYLITCDDDDMEITVRQS